MDKLERERMERERINREMERDTVEKDRLDRDINRMDNRNTVRRDLNDVPPREDKGFWQAKYIIPIAVLLVALVGFGMWSRDRNMNAVDEPVAMAPAVVDETVTTTSVPATAPVTTTEPTTTVTNPATDTATTDAVTGAPIPPVAITPADETVTPQSLTTAGTVEERLNRYTFPTTANAGALRTSVNHYMGMREHGAAGSVTVHNNIEDLNVRTGPSTEHEIITTVEHGRTYPAVMWAEDDSDAAGTAGHRWFLIADEESGRLMGWVSGRYTDTSRIVYDE